MLRLQGGLAPASVEEQTFWRILGVLQELKNMCWMRVRSYSFALEGKRGGCCRAGDGKKAAASSAGCAAWTAGVFSGLFWYVAIGRTHRGVETDLGEMVRLNRG